MNKLERVSTSNHGKIYRYGHLTRIAKFTGIIASCVQDENSSAHVSVSGSYVSAWREIVPERKMMNQEQRKDPENKPSDLLTDAENKQIYTLLGAKCITIATAIVQLYHTKPPDHSYWNKQDVGVFCFVKDKNRKNYFFRTYCLRRNVKIWEQEVYKNMNYNCSAPFLHSFEGDKCIYALNFASETEAEQVKQVVEDKLNQLRLRSAQKERLAKETAKSIQNIQEKGKKNSSKKKDRKRRLNKDDIGKPTEFRHITKVRFDFNKGLDVNTSDEMYKEIFKKAGINDQMLENRQTRDFLYEFIDTHRSHKNDEPVLTAPTRSAPKPPSSRAPPPPVIRNPPSSTSGHQNRNDQSPPPNFAPPPPPPPPRPPSLASSGAPAPPPPPPPPAPILHTDSTQKSANMVPPESPPGDLRSALMQSIRQGPTLKNVSTKPKSSEPDRDDMLKQIKEGIPLKSASDREIKSPRTSVHEVNDIAIALKKALETINVAKRGGGSSSESSSDDEWDAE